MGKMLISYIRGHILSLSLMLRPTVSWPLCLGIKHPSEAYDQIFITVRQLRVCWCGVLSLMRGWVCHLQLLLALASTVILRCESRGTRDHILLSQIRDFPFHRLLRLTGLQWRYLILPPHGTVIFSIDFALVSLSSHFVKNKTLLAWGNPDIHHGLTSLVDCRLPHGSFITEIVSSSSSSFLYPWGYKLNLSCKIDAETSYCYIRC
jgi:hypothetical protein